ncbi:MAG: hypothetical protein CMM47_09785 [Rhodospirillaceae bacterium]|nr:hypothetical protein [Rhodospirillaceae bacterium]
MLKAPSVTETYYHATAHSATTSKRLQGECVTDVCVVGGGLTGISAALNLAERGFSVIVLEAERVGHGASGRNGGQIVSGYSCDMARIREVVGTEASKILWKLGREAINDVDRRIEQHAICCDRRHGYFFAATNQRQLNNLYEIAEDWSKLYGYDMTVPVARDEVSAYVGTEAYVGGLSDPGGGHLHPLNYLFGLRRAAEGAGVLVFENSPVIQIQEGDRPVVHTSKGLVRSRFLVLAGNAYLGSLVPILARRIARVTSFVSATAQLAIELARRALPTNAAVADCNTALDYFRISADRRLVFGTGAKYSSGEPANLRRLLARRITQVFPYLAHLPLEYIWSGYIGITVNRIPDFGRVGPTIYHAQGFSGHGVALTGLAGKLIAETLAGDAGRFDLFSGINHRQFPGGPFRTPALILAMAYYKLRDRLG